MDYATAGEISEDSRAFVQQLLQQSTRGMVVLLKEAHMENRKKFLQNAVKAKRQIHNEIGVLIDILKEREIELCLEIDQECQDVDVNFIGVDGTYIPPPSETRISFRSDFPFIKNQLKEFGVLELINVDVEKNLRRVQKSKDDLDKELLQLSCANEKNFLQKTSHPPKNTVDLEKDILQQLLHNLSRIDLKLCTSRNPKYFRKQEFSETTTFGFIERVMRNIFNIADGKETRLWLCCTPDAYVHLDNEESTVASLAIHNYGQRLIIIEEMNDDGTWPKSFLSLKETPLQPHDKIQDLKPQASGSRQASEQKNDVSEWILSSLQQAEDHESETFEVINFDPTLKLDEDDSIEVLSTDSTNSHSASKGPTARKIGSFPRMLSDQFKKLKSRRKANEIKVEVENPCSHPSLIDEKHSQSLENPSIVCDKAAKCPDPVAMEVDKPLPSSLLKSSFKTYLTRDNPDMWLSNKSCEDKSKWLSNKDTATFSGHFMDDIPEKWHNTKEWLPDLGKLATSDNKTNQLLDEWLCKGDVASARAALNTLIAENPKEYPLSNLFNLSSQ